MERRLEENVWHLVNTDEVKHRYLDLPKDQGQRTHFKHNSLHQQYFIILPPVPEGE